MAVINNLPFELVEQIVSFLPFPDLVNSTLVSKSFRAVSQPLLFKSCRVVANRASPDGIKDFLCSLLAPGHESLANRVQYLTIACRIASSTGRLTTDQIRRIAHSGVRVTEGGISNQDISQDALVIVLLQLLPRLQVLDIGKLQTHQRFQQLLRKLYPVNPTDLPVALQSIREFRCFRQHPYGGISVRALGMLLDLPLLRTAKVHIIETYLGNAIETTPTSNVTDLTVSYHMATDWSLGMILGRIKVLERLSYNITNSVVDLHAVQLAEALQPHMNTLCYLRLDCFSLIESSTAVSMIGSLRNWPSLHTLVTSLLPFLGTGLHHPSPRLVNLLPRGLRRLEILRDLYWSQAEAVTSIRDVLMEKEQMVPLLEMVAVFPIAPSMAVFNTILNFSCVSANVTLAFDTSGW